MGFWSSLVHTASSIGGWVVNNAGSIADVVGTVAKVLPAVALEEDNIFDDVGDANATRVLYQQFSSAEALMATTAPTLFKQPTSTTGASIMGPYSLPGLWPHPPYAARIAPPDVAGDIHKFLALHGLPANLPAGSNQSVDLGNEIAGQMFAEANNPELKRVAGATDPYNYVNINIGPIQGISVVGGFMWYPIPMGNVGTAPTADQTPIGDDAHVSWHSLLYIWVMMPLNARRMLRERKHKLAVGHKNLSAASGGPYNSTTIRATWTGNNEGVDGIMSSAIQSVLANNKQLSLQKYPAGTGMTYTYQFSSPILFGPGAVNATVTNAISDQLVAKAAAAATSADQADPVPTMPQVKVISMQCLVADPTSGN